MLMTSLWRLRNTTTMTNRPFFESLIYAYTRRMRKNDAILRN